MLISASGQPEQVEAWLSEAKQHPFWQVDGDATASGIRFVRLSAPPDVPYREIGGLIYDGQRRRLLIAFSTVPPICENEDQ